MAAKKKPVNAIETLEKQIASTKMKLEKARESKMKSAERLFNTSSKKLTSAKTKLASLKEKVKQASAAKKVKNTPAAMTRLTKSKSAVGQQLKVVEQLSAETSSAKANLSNIAASVKLANSIARESEKAVKALERKKPKRKIKARKVVTTKTKPIATKAKVTKVATKAKTDVTAKASAVKKPSTTKKLSSNTRVGASKKPTKRTKTARNARTAMDKGAGTNPKSITEKAGPSATLTPVRAKPEVKPAPVEQEPVIQTEVSTPVAKPAVAAVPTEPLSPPTPKTEASELSATKAEPSTTADKPSSLFE